MDPMDVGWAAFTLTTDPPLDRHLECMPSSYGVPLKHITSSVHVLGVDAAVGRSWSGLEIRGGGEKGEEGKLEREKQQTDRQTDRQGENPSLIDKTFYPRPRT